MLGKEEKRSRIVYEAIDCEGLAMALALDAWEEDVRSKGLTKDQLYEDCGAGIKMVKPEFAYDFFALIEQYLLLINEHKMAEYETSAQGG